MPFTPSHAVVALPFLRTPLVPGAIAIGAMTPDLALFTRGIPMPYSRTHALEWLPLTLVLAVGLLLVWRCALRPAVRELAPAWLAGRLPARWDAGARAALRETLAVRPRAGVDAPVRPSWRGVLLLAASLAIGVLSHVAWDLFTHEGRWGSLVVPALAEPWGPWPGYRWLQHGSSAFGLLVLGGWAAGWLARRVPEPVVRSLPDAMRWVWWLSLPGALAAAWLAGLVSLGPLRPGFGVEHLAYVVLPQACAAWGIATLVLCVALQALDARRRGRERP